MARASRGFAVLPELLRGSPWSSGVPGAKVLQCTRNYTLIEIPNESQEAPKKPAGLNGKNWKELRKNKNMGNSRWEPKKRLTWYQIDHLKTLKRTQGDEWTNLKLAKQFGISVSAVCRILRSKFEASDEIKERQDKKAVEETQVRRDKFLQTLKSPLSREEEQEVVEGRAARFSRQEEQEVMEGRTFSREKVMKGRGTKFSKEEQEMMEGRGARFSREERGDAEEEVMEGRKKAVMFKKKGVGAKFSREKAREVKAMDAEEEVMEAREENTRGKGARFSRGAAVKGRRW